MIAVVVIFILLAFGPSFALAFCGLGIVGSVIWGYSDEIHTWHVRRRLRKLRGGA